MKPVSTPPMVTVPQVALSSWPSTAFGKRTSAPSLSSPTQTGTTSPATIHAIPRSGCVLNRCARTTFTTGLPSNRLLDTQGCLIPLSITMLFDGEYRRLFNTADEKPEKVTNDVLLVRRSFLFLHCASQKCNNRKNTKQTMEIKRDKYLNRLVAHQGNQRVKIITGIRRSGKSYLLFRLFKQRLLDAGVKPTNWTTASTRN